MRRPSVLICQNSLEFSTIAIESLLTAENKSLTPLSLPWETTGDINPPLSDYKDRDGNYFLGSCNGLVCVDRQSKSGGDGLILWNPSTRKFRRLPQRPPRCYRDRKHRFYHYYVWFGYDESIHDHKLVWLKYYPFSTGKTKVCVFTLKSDAWRMRRRRLYLDEGSSLIKVDDVNNPRIIGVLSDGAIHWRTYMEGRNVILALDLAAENLQVLDFAHYPFDPRGGGGCLVGGCSCMYDAHLGGMSFQIMKAYGWQGIVLPKWGERLYYPILLSEEEGKEILAVFDGFCQAHRFLTYEDKIVKFRMEAGGEKVSFPETLLFIPNGSPMMEDRFRCRNNIVLHMEESLVSLTFQEFESRSY